MVLFPLAPSLIPLLTCPMPGCPHHGQSASHFYLLCSLSYPSLIASSTRASCGLDVVGHVITTGASPTGPLFREIGLSMF